MISKEEDKKERLRGRQKIEIKGIVTYLSIGLDGGTRLIINQWDDDHQDYENEQLWMTEYKMIKYEIRLI